MAVRLVATYALLVAATLLVVAGLAIHLTRRHLEGALDAQLSATIKSFQKGPATLVDGPEELGAESRRWLGAQAFPTGQVVAVRTAEGDVLKGAGGIDLRDVSDSGELLTASEPKWWNLSGPDGSVRALSVPLMLDDRQIGTLAAGASREGLSDTLSTLLAGVAWASGVGLAFATILGFAAVRRTLRPLAQMSRDIELIERTQSFSRRVANVGPPDEVGRLAEAFNRMISRLEEAFRSQQRFLSDASHELRTPMTVVRGQLELLGEEVESVRARSSVGAAMEELDRMRRIVEDLLLLARLDEGLSLAREPVEVELIMREAVLRGVPSRRNVPVDVEPDLFALADADRLLQVLTNLVVNAVQHGGQGAAISLAARGDVDLVGLEVTDDGPGIDPSDLPHVFERLYRSHNECSAEGGAGVGLAIVDSLVEAMGGAVDVRSSSEQGTTFFVWLPRTAPPTRDLQRTEVLGIEQPAS